MKEFNIKDCALVGLTAKLQAQNMRELRDCIYRCEAASIYHHFCETLLRPTFDDPVYGNDFAVWTANVLNDPILAEKLGVINPYEYKNMEELRAFLIDMIDDHMSDLQFIPWARPGNQFFFNKAMTLVFDTGRTISDPDHLYKAIKEMSLGSIYYHFIEANRREPKLVDDFSAWLMKNFSENHPFLPVLSNLRNSYMPLLDLKRALMSSLHTQASEGE